MTIQALRSRRPESLADLLDTHGREIQSVAFLILRDRFLAEDVTIETLLTAYEKAGSIRDDAALRPWLLRVATNKALTIRRASSRVITMAAMPDRPGQRDLAADAADSIALLAGVAELPSQMRAAIVLRYYADLSVREVATVLGKSPNTIKAQLQVALDRLRRSLGEPVAPAATEANHV